MTRPSVFISHGRTESGDDMPMVAWSQEPDDGAVIDHYRELLPEEFEAFGDDYMGDLIRLTEVSEWGA